MKIGEFAKLNNATIRTLRYYDELGLLKPDNIDKFTGYRFYSPAKMQQMRQIQMMKEIGFTLLEIKDFLLIDESDKKSKAEFIGEKRKKIELEKQQTETRLTALDKLIVIFKDGEETQMDKSNYVIRGDVHNAAKIVKVFAGYNFLVFGAIDENGRLYMWGNNINGQCDIPEDLPPVCELGIGVSHTVALDVNGKLHGWGSPEYEELNFADDLPKMISVQAIGYKTAALSEDGRIFSWGNTNQGEQKYVLRNMGKITKLALAPYNTVAVNSDNKIFSWGVFNEPVPKFAVEFTTIKAAAWGTICLGIDGKVYGDLKQEYLHRKFKPKPEMDNIRKIAGGHFNFAAIDENGRIYVWGEYDETKNGESMVNIPLNLPPVTDVSIASNDIICLGADGKIYTWGYSAATGYYDVMVPSAFDGFRDGPVYEKTVAIVDADVPREVYTFDELIEAVRDNIKNITVKADFAVTNSAGESFYVGGETTLTIDEGVTLTVASKNFRVNKKLINNGTIKGGGRLIVTNYIEGTGIIDKTPLPTVFGGLGSLKIEAFINDENEMSQYLTEDSIYTGVAINYEKNDIIIDSDLVIPKGKKMWVSSNQTLTVSEGATLKIDGKVETYNKPVINGTVIGEIDVLGSANVREVYTFEELCEVTHQVILPGKKYTSVPKVTIKADMTASGGSFKIDPFTSLVIDKGVTLTINCDNFIVMGEFVNNGMIDGRGRVYIESPIIGTGNLNTANGLRFGIYDPDTDELDKYLAEDSIYSEIIYTGVEPPQYKSIFNIRPDSEKIFIKIEKDLVVPKSKSIWINMNGILKVSKGATLKVEGELKTFNEPVIEGEGIGNIIIIDSDKPRDVYTSAEFYEAARDRINKITVKDSINVPFSKENLSFNTLIIDKCVTLTSENCYLNIAEKLINNGLINGTGSIRIHDRIDGESGVDTSDGLRIYINKVDINEIGQYLTEDSIYTNALCINGEETVVTLNGDLVIPKDKSLWLCYRSTLKVSKGVTLKIDGKLETFNEPIIDGTVIGDITMMEKFIF